MSQSIFHVRPLDAGKGWAIDEYDGRGAWQRTIPIGPDGAPMDKQQAQRAVFQLRRKAVNSAPKAEPVNKPTGPSLTAQELAREFISEHYGYGPPDETVQDLALVIEGFAADSVSACVDVQNDINKAIREEIVGIIFRCCQPNNGALFSQIDDEIRALGQVEREPLKDITGCDV